MLKSQLQTTNFSTNFLSELPDEVQELIYRKVCMFVINELNALVTGNDTDSLPIANP